MNHLHAAITRQLREGFVIQFVTSRNYGEARAITIAAHHKRLEDLFRRHADLSCNRLRRQIFGIDLVLAQLVVHSKRVEPAHRIGFHRVWYSVTVTARNDFWPTTAMRFCSSASMSACV